MLYTGKGDKGDTYFFGSKKRASKGSCQTEALGALDEINTLLGACRAKLRGVEIEVQGRELAEVLERVQQDLFIIQAILAGAPKEITEQKVKFLESIIDEVGRNLPPIKSFFLPGATELSAFLDYARAVSRRAEREVVRYSEKEKELPKEVLAYLNRLSSLLYAFVRIINFELSAKETPPNYS